jgi:ubiquinone biosynthesis protein UbiJ
MSMDDAPYRLAYYERLLNRIASEVGGNAKFHGERTAAIMDEIDGLRKDMQALTARVDRIAEFLNKQKNGMKP